MNTNYFLFKHYIITCPCLKCIPDNKQSKNSNIRRRADCKNIALIKILGTGASYFNELGMFRWGSVDKEITYRYRVISPAFFGHMKF